MKYIDYVKDWFSLYINPVDYVGQSSLFVKHIFATLPFLDQIPLHGEVRALKDVITLNAQILIQLIEEENKEDAANAFATLKEQIIRLKKHTQDYALKHFNSLCADDPFFKKCQDYIQESVQGLAAKEQQAIKEAYLQMRTQELCLELTCQLAQNDQIEDLVTQTQIDKLSIEIEKFRFLGKVRCIILESQQGSAQLKQTVRSHLLAFFEKVEENRFFNAKYDKGYLRQQINEFVTEQFKRLQTLERINTEIKIDELSVQGFLLQEKHKHRSHSNLDIIKEQKISKRQKIAANQDIVLKLKQEIETALMGLCQNVLRSPVTDALQEVITLFNLHENIINKPKQKGFVKRVTGLFKLVSASLEQFLPSQMDLQLGAIGLATGAVMLGPNPLGIVGGLGVGAAAIKTHHTVRHAATEINQEWQACIEVLKGKFSSQYRSDAYQVTPALARVCGNDATANVINAFYLKILFNCDLRLAAYSSDDEALEITCLKEMRAKWGKHYQQLRAGKVKTKDFWEKTFKKDVALRVRELQALIQEHANTYLLCLYEGIASNELQRHQNRLLGIQAELNELKCLADRNAIKTMRENDTALYRDLVKTPLEYDFEDHVAQLVYHHAPSYLLFWLSEQAMIPSKQLSLPLPRFQGKTVWHLLAEVADGELVMQKILSSPKGESATRFSAKMLHKVTTFFASFREKIFFDPSVCYQEMNPIAYAFLHRRVPLLRMYLEEVLKHPSQAKKMGAKKLFAFMLKEHPMLANVLEAIKPKGFKAFTAALPFAQHTSIEMAMLAALTLYVAKEETLPNTLNAWQTLLQEMRKSPSAYIQVGSFKDYDLKEIDSLAKKYLTAQKPLLQLEVAKDKPRKQEPASIEQPPRALLLQLPFRAQAKASPVSIVRKKGKKKLAATRSR